MLRGDPEMWTRVSVSRCISLCLATWCGSFVDCRLAYRRAVRSSGESGIICRMCFSDRSARNRSLDVLPGVKSPTAKLQCRRCPDKAASFGNADISVSAEDQILLAIGERTARQPRSATQLLGSPLAHHGHFQQSPLQASDFKPLICGKSGGTIGPKSLHAYSVLALEPEQGFHPCHSGQIISLISRSQIY